MRCVTHIYSFSITDIGPTGTSAFESSKWATRMWSDPDVHHGIASAGSHRSRGTVAIGIGDSTDDSHASGIASPAQVVVDMPLHQVASEIKQSRVVNGDSGFGDKHRGHKRALVAINFVHKRFGG